MHGCNISQWCDCSGDVLQGVAFFHAGSDILRSKSLDRDAYNSGASLRAKPIHASYSICVCCTFALHLLCICSTPTLAVLCQCNGIVSPMQVPDCWLVQ